MGGEGLRGFDDSADCCSEKRFHRISKVFPCISLVQRTLEMFGVFLSCFIFSQVISGLFRDESCCFLLLRYNGSNVNCLFSKSLQIIFNGFLR